MKKILFILLIALTGFIFTGCDNDTSSDPDKTDPSTETPGGGGAATTDDDGTVYETFEYNLGLYQVGWAEGWIDDDATETPKNTTAKGNIALTYDNETSNGLGSAKVQLEWADSSANQAKGYVTLYSNGGDNAEIIDGTGKTFIAKIKLPAGFLDGFDSDEATEGVETFPGVQLYIKGDDWQQAPTDGARWFGGYDIKTVLDSGVDDITNGIYTSTEEGFVILKAIIGTDINTLNGTESTLYETGLVIAQNGDSTLTNDMAFYIDYIDFE